MKGTPSNSGRIRDILRSLFLVCASLFCPNLTARACTRTFPTYVVQPNFSVSVRPRLGLRKTTCGLNATELENQSYKN